MHIRSESIARAAAFCLAGTALVGAAGPARAAPGLIGTQVSLGLVGDINRDGIADEKDLSVVTANLGRAGGFAQGDLDGNGQIDDDDLTLLNTHYKRHRAAAYVGKVADTNTFVPGAANKFYSFNAPVMDTTGAVAFVGVGVPMGGVYKYVGGTLSKVADRATTIPGTSGLFYNFGLPSLNRGKVAIVGYDSSGRGGIFTDRSGALVKLVDQTSARPGGVGYSGFGDPSLSDTGVAYIGNLGIGSFGIYNYAFATGQASVVALSDETIPGGTGQFTGFGNAIGDATTMYHTGTGINQAGIYKRAGGQATVVVNNNTTVPGTSSKFTSTMSNVSRSGDNLSFNGTFSGRSGIFAAVNGALQMVADTATAVPDGNGRFTSFRYSAIGGSGVAFVGRDEAGLPGIYGWSAGELTRIVDTSITIGGKRIADLTLSNQAVEGNKVVFSALFSDNTSGVFVASLIPSPAPGDINGDGVTDSADMRILRKNFGKAGGYAQGDLDGDGVVEFNDFQIMERNYGKIGLTPLRGDADGDGKVDGNDYKILRANFEKYGTVAQGDFDGDGQVTFNDFQILEYQWGKTTASLYEPFGSATAADLALDLAGGSVPEPGAIGVMGLALIGLGRRRRA